MSRLKAIKKETNDWLVENAGRLRQEGIESTVLIDSKDCLRILLENEEKMGEILIEDAEFAPYRHFKFEIAQIIDEKAQITYAWYDNDKTTVEAYRLALANGIEQMIAD